MTVLEKIKETLQRHGIEGNTKKIHREILPFARELCDNHPEYLREIGSLGVYVRDIVSSSNINSHGHFLEKRGRSYILGLFREFGLYDKRRR